MRVARVPRRAATLVVIASLAVAAGTDVGAEDGAAAADERLITSASVNPPTPFQAFDAAAVGLFDLSGDGVMEIIAHNDNNRVYVLHGDGTLALEIETPIPDRWGARALNGVAVGDVNGNGVPTLVIANSAGWLVAVEVTPPLTEGGSWTAETLWEVFLDPTELDPDFLDKHDHLADDWTGFIGLDGAPYLADVTGNGADEVFVQSDDVPGQYALNGNGTLRWWHDWSDGNANPVGADLTGDGAIEVIYPSDGGHLFIFDGATGREHCGFTTSDHGSDPGSISVAPALHDVTGDGRKEIFFGARQAVWNDNETWIDEQHARYYAITADCELLWTTHYEWGNPHVHMRAAAVDVTGDGVKEIIFQDWNTIGHKPGDWERTGPSNLFAVNALTGDLVWHVETPTYWSNKDIAVADVTGNGEEEIVVVAPFAGADGLTLYTLTGERAGFIPVGHGWTVTKSPVVGDVTGNGNSEIVVPVHRDATDCPPPGLDVGCREGALRIIELDHDAGGTWTGRILYNQAHDQQGLPPRANVTWTDAASLAAEPGTLAVDVAVANASGVEARPEGRVAWTPLEPAGGAWAGPGTPRNGETWHVRAFLPERTVAYAAFTWTGEGDGAITVHAEDADGNPVEGASVTLSDGDVPGAVTDAAGHARVDGVPPGSHEVRVEADGVGLHTSRVTIGPGELHHVNATLEPPRWGWLPVSLPTLGFLLAVLVAGAAVAAVSAMVRARRP